MRTKVIFAATIEMAVQRILNELKEDPNTFRSISNRNNVIYFDGWDGLGASAVLQEMARRLSPASDGKPAATVSNVVAGLEFGQIIHIDCSKWENRRALQRAVAEQLELPPKVMEMFDKQDEEDDFRGVAQGSRAELEPVFQEMYQHIQKLNRRILVIFHNGSSEEIDMASFCGFPPSRVSTNKVLWTFQGRFRLKPRIKVDAAMKNAGTTDVFLSVIPNVRDPQDLWSYLVRKEAEELVAAHNIIKGSHCIIHQPAQVEECFLYMLELYRKRNQSIDYDLATHGANYWICDGIIKHVQKGERDIDAAYNDDGLWRTAEALQREMQLDVEYNNQDALSLHLARCAERKPSWTSPTCGIFLLIPIRYNFEKYFNDLGVLKISCCTFHFQSPPFLCCHNLRFLWLDHCHVITPDGAGKEDDISRCFQRLWVLDIRYTKGCDQILCARMFDVMIQLRELNVVGAQDWDMGQLQGRLPNVRKLRVSDSILQCSCPENELFSEMSRMELLDFSDNSIVGPLNSFCGPRVGKSSSSIETVIIDNYYLEKISFRGCTNLKDMLLSGHLGSLKILDISGTAVKTLDLTTTAIWSLDELHLLDCEKLCAIMWPPKDKRTQNLGKLYIDTTRCSSDATRSSASSAVLHGNRPASEFDWYISVRDARLLGSLEPVYPAMDSPRKIYVEISSPTVPAGATKNEIIIKSSNMKQESVIQHTVPAYIYADIRVDHLQKANNDGDGDALGIMWDAPHLPNESCYMHIQDQGGSEQSGTITVPDFVLECAKILHVRDSLSITILPSAVRYGAEWFALEWCRVERCPKLDCVFTPQHSQNSGRSYNLRIFWASQLPKARYIWKRSEPSFVSCAFFKLTSLHLDYCPRLIHVLPLTIWVLEYQTRFLCLVTLEIMWCGDLNEVLPLDIHAKELQRLPELPTLSFPKLKHIHLHELPKLHSICGLGITISAPELDTVKIRGCWSLKRLPVVKKAVLCDCEKEWWDSLEWEDALQKKLYKLTHPKYYKKTPLLKGSVLR